MTHPPMPIRLCSGAKQGQEWLERYRGRKPIFACVLGFTDTGLIPGISAAGATPDDRRITAIADAEFLYNGTRLPKQYPLPPLTAGASPVLISRAVVEALDIPVYLFNAGLPLAPPVEAIDLGGAPAKCLSQGNALELATVKHLLEQGFIWGEKLATTVPDGYVILSECVVGGTTTALAVLTGLGVDASGKVNSSHPKCNHEQKWALVQAGLHRAKIVSHSPIQNPKSKIQNSLDPLELVAAVGDPMQIAVAGMTIAASRSCGVLLAGGTQMLAVYALIQAIAAKFSLDWRPQNIVVGTTRWVAEDSTGDTVGLARAIGAMPDGKTPPLLASALSFADSRYAQLRAYEQGYVKEGVGAGGAAIAAYLYQGWEQDKLLVAIEALLERCITC